MVHNKAWLRLGILKKNGNSYDLVDLKCDMWSLSEKVGLALMKEHIRKTVNVDMFNRNTEKVIPVDRIKCELNGWYKRGNSHDMVVTLGYTDDTNRYNQVAEPIIYTVEVKTF